MNYFNSAANEQIKFIAIFCFCFSVLCCIAFGVSVFKGNAAFLLLVIAAIWYQVGASLIKKKKWAWYTCLTLVGITCISSLNSVFNTIVLPAFSEDVTGVGYGRWIALLLLLISGILIKSLIGKPVRDEFKTNT
jgi:hypothetical protein